MEGREPSKFEQKWDGKENKIFDWIFEDHPLYGLAIFGVLAVTVLGGVTAGCTALEKNLEGKRPEGNKNAFISVQKWPGVANAAAEEMLRKFNSENYTNVNITMVADGTHVQGKEKEVDFDLKLDNQAQVKYALFTNKNGAKIAFDYDVSENVRPGGTIELFGKNPDGTVSKKAGFYQRNGEWFERLENGKDEVCSAKFVAKTVTDAAKEFGIDVNAPVFRMVTEGHFPAKWDSDSYLWLMNSPRGHAFH